MRQLYALRISCIYLVLAVKVHPQITQIISCNLCNLWMAFCLLRSVCLNALTHVDSEFLSQLNEQQREAVLATEGPLLILAGAGSGKTRVIAHRIAYLIAEKKVPSWNILAVTFTNKAADEMRQRVQRLLRTQDRASLPLVSTFHSFCVRILRQDIEKLNDKYTRRFTIYDQDDSLRLIKQCIRSSATTKNISARARPNRLSVQQRIAAKIQLLSPPALNTRTSAALRWHRSTKCTKTACTRTTRSISTILLIKTVRLLRDVPEVREKYNNKFRYILVDEYQDTNSLQFALIRLITQKSKNICGRRRRRSVDLQVARR